MLKQQWQLLFSITEMNLSTAKLTNTSS